MDMSVCKNALKIMLLSVCLFGASSALAWHGGGGGHGGGWHGGGWHGGGWHGAGWHGGNWHGGWNGWHGNRYYNGWNGWNGNWYGVGLFGFPNYGYYPYNYNSYYDCNRVRYCNRYGNCRIRTVCY